MGIFDDLMGKAKAAADVAGKKTGEIMEISKLKLQINQLTCEVDKAYSRMGALVYESVKNNADAKDVINVIVAEIDDLNGQIEEAQAKINQLKNVVKCTNCGTIISEDSIFCSRCGEPIVRPPEPEEANEPVADAPAEADPDVEEAPVDEESKPEE